MPDLSQRKCLTALQGPFWVGEVLASAYPPLPKSLFGEQGNEVQDHLGGLFHAFQGHELHLSVEVEAAGKDVGAKVVGPIPLPTNKKIFTVNRSTFVNKKSREQFELDSYVRLIDIDDSNAKTVDALMKLELPSGVEVEIKV